VVADRSQVSQLLAKLLELVRSESLLQIIETADCLLLLYPSQVRLAPFQMRRIHLVCSALTVTVTIIIRVGCARASRQCRLRHYSTRFSSSYFPAASPKKIRSTKYLIFSLYISIWLLSWCTSLSYLQVHFIYIFHRLLVANPPYFTALMQRLQVPFRFRLLRLTYLFSEAPLQPPTQPPLLLSFVDLTLEQVRPAFSKHIWRANLLG
jgi:hypothetical protein